MRIWIRIRTALSAWMNSCVGVAYLLLFIYVLILGDLLSEEDREAMARGEEPDWVQAQRDDFTETRDKDKDGKLNKEEVGEWVMPTGYDAIESEAAHLMYHADKDKVRVEDSRHINFGGTVFHYLFLHHLFHSSFILLLLTD